MNKYLLEYCKYAHDFKSKQNVTIINDKFKIVYISNHDFFGKYSSNFKENVDILECLSHLPCFELKQQIYDNLIKTKKVLGYFVAQNVSEDKEYEVDCINLSPILDPEENLVGIELIAIDMDGLPIVTLLEDRPHHNVEIINLTEREREILTLKVMGKTNLEISDILSTIYNKDLSQHTVANIIKQQLYTKLNVGNKSSLIKRAHTMGLDRVIPKSLITNNQLILFPTIELDT